MKSTYQKVGAHTINLGEVDLAITNRANRFFP